MTAGRRPIAHRSGIALGLTLFLVLAGTGVGNALWSSSSTVGTTVSAGTLGVTQTMTGSLNVAYNASIQSATAAVTVTNAGSLAAPFTLAFRGTSANSLAATVAVTAWPVAAATVCTASAVSPTTATSGTWTTIAPISGTLAAASAAVYCIRTALTPAQVTAATVGSLAATLALTSTLGSWTTGSTIPVIQTAIDSTAPTTSGLSATGTTDARTTLNWTATDNVAATAYEVRRGGTLIATVTAPTYLDTGLSLGTTYSYTVRARDAAGNWSADSPALAVLTVATPNAASWYRIVNPVSGMCVDGFGAGQTDGTKLIIWRCHGNSNQAWRLGSSGPGVYTVAVQNAPSILWEIEQSTGLARLWSLRDPARPLQQLQQQWAITPIGTGTGTFSFVNKRSNLCLEVPGTPITEGNQLRERSCASPATPAQTFTLTAVG